VVSWRLFHYDRSQKTRPSVKPAMPYDLKESAVFSALQPLNNELAMHFYFYQSLKLKQRQRIPASPSMKVTQHLKIYIGPTHVFCTLPYSSTRTTCRYETHWAFNVSGASAATCRGSMDPVRGHGGLHVRQGVCIRRVCIHPTSSAVVVVELDKLSLFKVCGMTPRQRTVTSERDRYRQGDSRWG
jgi:hypothetical protein